MLGERIKRGREAAGLSLRALAERVGVSAMAVSKYERGLSTPSSDVLLGLARALGVRVEYFFREGAAELSDVEYRKRPDLPERLKRRIVADVEEQLERWLALEAFLPTPWSRPFVLPEGLPAVVEGYDAVEDVAVAVRGAWRLGLNPIPELVDTLEWWGVKVFVTAHDEDDRFDGFSARVEGMPVVVVGSDWPGDRQRFTLAHELGHLMLKGRLADHLDEELACNRFAGAFLAPAERVVEALGNRRKWLEPQELMLLKQEWGLSIQGWSYRASDLGILPKERFRELWVHFRRHGWHKREPDPQLPRERPRLFAQLVYRALAEDLVGESKAAELLGMSLSALRACRNMECPDGGSDQ